MPVESVHFVGDFDPDVFHLGLFLESTDSPTGVITMLAQNEDESPSHQSACMRVRGMAVSPEFQGQGLGKKLLAEALVVCRDRNTKVLWCNARSHVLAFYKAFGFEECSEEFFIPHGGPHFKMRLQLNP
jgi:predicted GNAT family N-acyltransferase